MLINLQQVTRELT